MKAPLSIIIEQQKKIYEEHTKYFPRKNRLAIDIKKTFVRLKK
jgi:hypothetical protein